jgi:hypothetical protein
MNWNERIVNLPRVGLTFFLVFFLSFLLNAQPDRENRPEYFPTPPKSDKSLFFIQRNLNQNTIVYDANLMEDGQFKRSKPIDAYWLRYSGAGNRKELGWLERTFAYGYSSKKEGDGFSIKLTAYNDRRIHLEKRADGKPIATITCNGKTCQLDYIYVFADESSSWPKVFHVDIHATDLVTGKPVKERILNN